MTVLILAPEVPTLRLPNSNSETELTFGRLHDNHIVPYFLAHYLSVADRSKLMLHQLLSLKGLYE